MIRVRLLPCLGLVFLCIPATLPAQERVGLFGSLGLGGYWSDESFNGNGANLGAAIDVFPLSWLGLEAGVDGGNHARDYEGRAGKTRHLYADLILRFTRSRFQPYLVGGVGWLHSVTNRWYTSAWLIVSEEDSLAVNLGLGALYNVGRRWLIRPELRLVGASGDAAIKRYFRLSLGIGYYFI